MNDKIKEILSNDNIHIIECDKNWCNAYGYEKSQLKEDLLDCITNLQEEKEDYKSRCEKAIEYINKNKHLNWYVESIFTDELENILNGGDKQ